jgi:F-type H+-transporting ATPase subunit delta
MSERAQSKPSMPINVGAQKVAAIYAHAFVAAAEKTGQTDAAVAELNALASDVLAPNPKLEAVFASALIPPDEKEKILDRLFKARVSPLLLDFLKVISNHGRLEIVRQIAQEVSTLHDELRGRVRVRLSTATPLDEGFSRKISDSLHKLFGGQPELEPHVDPRLIGGIVLRVGDTVYDGSLSRQLAQVREQMINRSVHEIQSRRDRFRHPGGN